MLAFKMQNESTDRMMSSGETAEYSAAAPKGNAEALRQKGRTRTTLRKVRLAARRRCNPLRRGISQVQKRRRKTAESGFAPFCASKTFPERVQGAVEACPRCGRKVSSDWTNGANGAKQAEQTTESM